jgi:hypothetical protein
MCDKDELINSQMSLTELFRGIGFFGFISFKEKLIHYMKDKQSIRNLPLYHILLPTSPLLSLPLPHPIGTRDCQVRVHCWVPILSVCPVLTAVKQPWSTYQIIKEPEKNTQPTKHLIRLNSIKFIKFSSGFHRNSSFGVHVQLLVFFYFLALFDVVIVSVFPP